MYEVLIVEDEQLLLNGLVKTIAWESLGFCVAGFANAAEKALELLEGKRFDVVITDIVMPGHDGLWLLENIKRKQPDARMIILSNHAQFDYAHRAIQLGVFEYVVKLDLYDMLPQALRRLKEDLDRSRHTGIGESPELIQILEERRRKPFGYEACYGIIVSTRAPSDTGLTQPIESKMMYARKNGLFLLTIVEGSQGKLRRAVGEALRQYGGQAACGICLEHDNEDFTDCYFKAVKMLDYARITGARACAYDEINRSLELHTDTRKDMDAVVSHLLGGNVKAFAETVDTMINCCIRARGVLVGTPRAMLAGMLGRLTDFYPSNQVKGIFDNYIHAIYEIDSMTELTAFISGNAQEMERHLDEYRKLSRSSFGNVLAYIDSQLTKELKMEDIAKQFFMSPSYFSLQFKKCTGVRFVDYVKKRSLEKAANYLKSSALNVSEVAELVGYHDAKHFSKLFKERYGLLPTEFMKTSRAGRG